MCITAKVKDQHENIVAKTKLTGESATEIFQVQNSLKNKTWVVGACHVMKLFNAQIVWNI